MSVPKTLTEIAHSPAAIEEIRKQCDPAPSIADLSALSVGSHS
ncbi:hypothetical protein [Rhodococcus sp. USK10]|nr:hypothetical protein [Rhodococcus sp. USK10]